MAAESISIKVTFPLSTLMLVALVLAVLAVLAACSSAAGSESSGGSELESLLTSATAAIVGSETRSQATDEPGAGRQSSTDCERIIFSYVGGTENEFKADIVSICPDGSGLR